LLFEKINKLRGGYYTPEIMANFMANWINPKADMKILEPSCGDGQLLIPIIEHLLQITNPKTISQNLLAIELIPTESEKTIQRLTKLGVNGNHVVQTADFFDYYTNNLENGTFDAIIGNPPYLRFHDFPTTSKRLAFKIMEENGLKPSGFTNSWVPFLIVSSLLLNETGKLAMIVPAQLFHVNYAQETRLFLSEHFSRLTIVTFDKLMFPQAQQDVVILLGDRYSDNHEGIRLIEVDNEEALENINIEHIEKNYIRNEKPLDHSSEKWTQYYLQKEDIVLVRKYRNSTLFKQIGDICSIDIGVVTGKNKYFILNQEQKENNDIEDNALLPILTNTRYVNGVSFLDQDWIENRDKNAPCYLFYPRDELSPSVKKYIEKGESLEYHTGYKTSRRNPWYKVKSTRVPEGFMIRQIYDFTKIVSNNSDATCTDTIHRIFCKTQDIDMLSINCLNSITFTFAELLGRSYGGGVLTLEPSEAEKIPIPSLTIDTVDFHHIDDLIRKNDIESVLNLLDHELLIKGLNIPRLEVNKFRSMWKLLRSKRIRK
jgi:adenine-specific DNA-methyltransferase